jgi:hypothetical protein
MPPPPPGQIWTLWFQASFPCNPCQENTGSSMPAHMEGCEGNFLVETLIQSLRMLGPLDGASDALGAGHPLYRFIPRSGYFGWL